MKHVLLAAALLLSVSAAMAQEAFFMAEAGSAQPSASDAHRLPASRALSEARPEPQYDPPVTLKKTGDFLVLKVKIENDSRELTQRRAEIYSTLENIVKAAETSSSIKLHSGEYPIDRTNYRIKLQQGSERPDTSTADVYVKTPLKKGDDIPKLTEDLRGFVSGIKGSGRTELLPGEVGLSLVDPEQYRYELISKIAEDTRKVAGMFGGAFSVSGLDKKLKARRVSVTEVELFLDYAFEIVPMKTEASAR